MSQPNLYNATDYANWQLVLKSAVTAVAMQAQLNQGYVTIKGRKVNPLAASCVVSVDNISANQENVTLTAVDNPAAENGFPPTRILATFTKAHGIKAIVASSTNGLQEAVNDAISQGGGLVVIDNTWPGAAGSAVITALPVGATTVGIQDIRSGVSTLYAWSGSAYVAQAATQLASPTFTGTVTMPKLVLTAVAPTVAAAQIGLGSTVQTTVGSAGAASALPATPTGFLIINVAGTAKVIPYYDAS